MADNTFSENLTDTQTFQAQYTLNAEAYAALLASAISESFYDSITAGLNWDIDADTIQRPTEFGVPAIDDMVIPTFDDSALRDWDPIDYLLRTSYDSEFLEDLEQNCRSIFAGTIPGFTDVSAAALYNYREERDVRDLALGLEQATVQFAAKRGFPIPPDALGYKQNEILRRFADARADATRDKTATLADKLMDAFKHAMSVGVQVESLRADVMTKMSNMYLDKIKAQVAVYDTNMRAIIAAFEGKISEARLRVQNNQANVGNFQAWQALVEASWSRQKDLQLRATQLRMEQATNEITSRVQAMEKVMHYYTTAITSIATAAQALDIRNTSVEG